VAPAIEERRLAETRRAFDRVAAEYDGPLGNNPLVQRMRERLWVALGSRVRPGGRLLDLGCGTGLDAAQFAHLGYAVVATDWAPEMVRRTRERAARAGLAHRLRAELVGIHELARLRGERFDAVYSDLGPLNCVPDLRAVAGSCAELLPPGGLLVASVIGRDCPWELAYYLLRGEVARARVRAAEGAVPVRLRDGNIWTRYYTPGEFYRPLRARFALVECRALGLFLPPPYLLGAHRRLGAFGRLLGEIDDRTGGWPILRDLGDHFLMVLRRRG
jgi:SAM-dependent methyltransferase